MYGFRSSAGAVFGYSVDFGDHGYANVSFFDSTKKRILFHLSLRQPKNLAVVNARPNGEWQAEIPKQVELPVSGNHVRIHFEDDQVRVVLNDIELFHFDGKFPDLNSIEYVNFGGGVQEDSLLMEGAGNNDRDVFGELKLQPGLEVRGWAVDPTMPNQNAVIEVDGLDEPLQMDRFEMPKIAAHYGMTDTRIGLHATLPGRVWVGAKAQGQVELHIRINGLLAGEPLVLRKEDVLTRIEEIAKDEAATTFDLLLAIEHVRFGPIWETLSTAAQTVLHKAAATYGVSDFLAEAIGEAAQPDIALPPENPEVMLLQRVRRAFGASLARDPAQGRLDLLLKLLKQYPLTPQMQRDLFLAVVDEFCQGDEFPALYRHAAAQDLHRYARRDNRWHNSVILPFLYMEGRLLEVQALLWKLAEDGEGWAATPAIGWTVRSVLKQDRGPHTEKQAEDILYAFIGFVDKQAQQYWARSACTVLVDTAVEMVVQSPRFADYMRLNLMQFALRNYGLSRVFWEKLTEQEAKGRITIEGRLAVGRDCFAALQAGDHPEAALRFFETCNNPEADRFRLELLGPSGIEQVADRPLLDQLLMSGREPGESAVRALAFPGLDATPSGALDTVVRRTIRDLHDTTGKSPYYELQGAVSREATALLADLARGPVADASERLQDLLSKLGVLATSRCEFLGIGLALSLFETLLRLDEEDLATHVLARISAVRADVPKEHHVGLFKQPALRAALVSLAALPDNRMAQAALALFPNFDPTEGGMTDPDALEAMWGDASPLFDTIVTVFSCKPYLASRIDPMRKGWLSRLEDLGIPYVVVVGDGDGQREGDIVYLDAPDDYEGLPQKTLKTIEWVYENTPFSYMLKIDDDCFINPEEFFQSQSYRKFDYYGRRLMRHIGQTDRVWHFEKSRSARGRQELDKSPEPAEYADGGSGYVLSRWGMRQALEASRTEAGARLIAASFMEDKMLGDLLATRGITVRDEDYYVSIRRRSYGKALPVAMWQNSFHASQSSLMKQVHLDTDKDQAEANARLDQHGLFPKKIWPTHAPVALGFESNLLELISPEDKLAKLNAEPVAVVACMRNEMFMLPQFLAHYRALGVKAFLIADNGSDDGTLEYLADQPDVALFSVDTSYKKSHYGVEWQMAIIANLRVGRWSLVADTDELLVYKGWEKTPLPKLLSGAAFKAADAVRLYMLDMYPQGPLSDVTMKSGDPFAEAGFVETDPFRRDSNGQGPYSNSPTVTSALRHRLLPGSRPELFVAQKYALLNYRSWMKPSDGFHYVADIKVAEMEMLFAHFKYTAEFRAKALAEVKRGQHFNNAEEYRKYLNLMSEGREVIFDDKTSVHWTDCAEVKRILEA